MNLIDFHMVIPGNMHIDLWHQKDHYHLHDAISFPIKTNPALDESTDALSQAEKCAQCMAGKIGTKAVQEACASASDKEACQIDFLKSLYRRLHVAEGLCRAPCEPVVPKWYNLAASETAATTSKTSHVAKEGAASETSKTATSHSKAKIALENLRRKLHGEGRSTGSELSEAVVFIRRYQEQRTRCDFL